MSEVFGPIGNECTQQAGFHYPDKDLYIEVVSPETGEPVPKGEVGVGVYTTLWEKGISVASLLVRRSDPYYTGTMSLRK